MRLLYDGCITYMNDLELDGDDCEDSSCQGGATCVDGYFNYTCHCENGITGDRCQCKSDKHSLQLSQKDKGFFQDIFLDLFLIIFVWVFLNVDFI